VAAAGLLALVYTDVYKTLVRRGAQPQESDLNALALSPSMVDSLNAKNLSWTARIPAGMENARHADLGRLAGGA
jgi:hypothetical protein